MIWFFLKPGMHLAFSCQFVASQVRFSQPKTRHGTAHSRLAMDRDIVRVSGAHGRRLDVLTTENRGNKTLISRLDCDRDGEI